MKPDDIIKEKDEATSSILPDASPINNQTETAIKRNKENLTPLKNINSNLNMSGTMIVSFSPLTTPSSEHYGTPKSILSEINDSIFASLDGTLTNSPQKQNSSMYLIDLTTPAPIKVSSSSTVTSQTTPTSTKSSSNKLTAKTPTSKVKNNLLRSALKNSTTRSSSKHTIEETSEKSEVLLLQNEDEQETNELKLSYTQNVSAANLSDLEGLAELVQTSQTKGIPHLNF